MLSSPTNNNLRSDKKVPIEFEEATTEAFALINDPKTFVRAVLSGRRRNMMPNAEKIEIRPIKLKNEIIRMNHPAIRPEEGRAHFIKPKKLQEWLDRGTDDLGRPVVMIDTRNEFEVDYGTFENALHFNIEKFTQFPKAITAHKEALADKTLVSFCTGGIRCEKSGLYMREIGLQHSYQLEGGILKYFEEVGSAHYKGTCFVFDEREALEPTLDSIPVEHSIRKKLKAG